MSSRAPTYKSAINLLRLHKYLEKPRTFKQLKNLLKVSHTTLNRYINIIRSIDKDIRIENNKYFKEGK